MTLYIVACSFEERCIALARDLAHRDSSKEALVIDFLGYENVGPYLHNRTMVLNCLAAKGFDPHKIEVDPNRPLEALSRIGDAIANAGPEKIILDISVLPKPYLFGLCRLLLTAGIETVVRYYKPSKYGRFLSRGIGSVSSISGYEGDISPTSEISLVIVLGFEGYKALHVWESIGPTRCTALLGDPPYRDEFLQTSKESNGELLSAVEGIQFGKLHTFDVKLAIAQLSDVLHQSKRCSHDIAFVLCPLGTKLQSLACFGLAYCNPEITIANVSSLIYYAGEYSQGIDPSYTEIPLQDIVAWASAT